VKDTFYIKDDRQRKIVDPVALAKLHRDLSEVAGRGRSDGAPDAR
jgi:hypothetical protein